MEEDQKIVHQFITALQDMMLGMQQIDSSCMEAYKDVSKREFTLLVTLGKTGAMIMREVASLLGIPMSTATGTIDKLIDKGYVVRKNSMEDRRLILIRLSDEGQAIYQMLQDRMSQFGKHILRAFSPEDQLNFVTYLERAASTLKVQGCSLI